MPSSGKSAIELWEQENIGQGLLCDQCKSLFSALEVLQSLTSPHGRLISTKTFFDDNTTLTCPLCIMIKDNHLGDMEMRFGSLADWKIRLEAECETLEHPHVSLLKNFGQKYPLNILSVRSLIADQAKEDERGAPEPLLAIYKPPDLLSTSPLQCFPQSFDMACDSYMQKAKQKLEECLNSHDYCNDGMQTPAFFPSRVIDVGMGWSFPDACFPRLHVSYPGQKDKYVALSYCWGGDQPKTTKDNIKSMTQRLSNVALTIQDAITVTRKLGLRYLWVDAICIVQDDEDDMSRELKVMGPIYSNATLTICVLRSLSASSGFLKTEPPQGCNLPFYLPDGSLTSVVAVPCREPIFDTRDVPLNTRAWTFQEKLLSKRLLIFDSAELKWQCPNSYKKYSEYIKRLTPSDPPSDDGHSAWSTISSGSSSLSDTEYLSGKNVETLTPRAFQDAQEPFFLTFLAIAFPVRETTVYGGQSWRNMLAASLQYLKTDYLP